MNNLSLIAVPDHTPKPRPDNQTGRLIEIDLEGGASGLRSVPAAEARLSYLRWRNEAVRTMLDP
jgi:hypothetical protein